MFFFIDFYPKMNKFGPKKYKIMKKFKDTSYLKKFCYLALCKANSYKVALSKQLRSFRMSKVFFFFFFFQ